MDYEEVIAPAFGKVVIQRAHPAFFHLVVLDSKHRTSHRDLMLRLSGLHRIVEGRSLANKMMVENHSGSYRTAAKEAS